MNGPLLNCRICLDKVQPVIDLGKSPIANDFSDGPSPFAMRYPLGLSQCINCGHVQISFNIDGETLFKDYKYQTPQAERTRLASYAEKLMHEFPQAARKPGVSKNYEEGRITVLEIGSNNGIFVEELNKAGMWAAGIDPSPHAPKTGMPKWFNSKTAKLIKFSCGEMKLIVANNVFAHVDDIRNVMSGVEHLLAADGNLIFEVQYLPDMIAGGNFDMIYFEHKDYHTLKPLVLLGRKFSMGIKKVEHIPTHGGSIRVYMGRGDGIEVKDPEINWGEFKEKIAKDRASLLAKLEPYEKIACFGATAKATTLLSHYGITQRISYCIDETPSKQGRYLPGTNIEIKGFDYLNESKPEAILITAWNYADIIRPRLEGFKTIVPFSIT